MEPSEVLMRRVLVLLDASRTGLAAVETAARMAAQAQAELTGLFVEDAALLRSAALPFAREINLVSASLRPLSTAEVERRLRAQAAALRVQLESTAQRFSVHWSLQVSRGEVNAATVGATQPDDVLIVQVGPPTGIQRGHRGAQVAALASLAQCPVLVLTGPAKLSASQEIAVLIDDASSENTALPRAGIMARAEHRALAVLGAPCAHPAKRTSAVRDWLRAHRLSATVTTLPSDQISALIAAMRPTSGRTLVFRQGTMGLAGSRLAELIRAADFPILITP